MCDVGFFPENFACSPCPVTCSACNSLVDCTNCTSNYEILGGICDCNATAQMFEDGGFCSTCETFITNCTSCTGVGPLAVACVTCVDGTYLNSSSNTCEPCSPFCSLCTITDCTQCISPTFSINATECYCNETAQVFLNTSSTPESCDACANFIPSCLDCSNSSGTLFCQQCSVALYFDGTACVPCNPHCLNCTSSACFECEPTFNISGADCICNQTAGMVINSADTQCVICDGLVSNCQVCITTPTIYC